MAGRGRKGQGRGLSFAVEGMGFGSSESHLPPILQPPPLFPPLEFKPVPLINNEEQNYLLALKQELRGTLRDSGYFIQPTSLKKDVERYSDKYHQMTTNNIQWDWTRFPKELKRITRVKKQSTLKPNIIKKKHISQDEVKNKFEMLESTENVALSEEEQEEGKEDEENDVEKDEEVYDEEEQEEGTDYAINYFDNGEEFVEEDDNLDDGPIY